MTQQGTLHQFSSFQESSDFGFFLFFFFFLFFVRFFLTSMLRLFIGPSISFSAGIFAPSFKISETMLLSSVDESKCCACSSSLSVLAIVDESSVESSSCSLESLEAE